MLCIYGNCSAEHPKLLKRKPPQPNSWVPGHRRSEGGLGSTIPRHERRTGTTPDLQAPPGRVGAKHETNDRTHLLSPDLGSILICSNEVTAAHEAKQELKSACDRPSIKQQGDHSMKRRRGQTHLCGKWGTCSLKGAAAARNRSRGTCACKAIRPCLSCR